jgi:hypothetical protein
LYPVAGSVTNPKENPTGAHGWKAKLSSRPKRAESLISKDEWLGFKVTRLGVSPVKSTLLRSPVQKCGDVTERIGVAFWTF